VSSPTRLEPLDTAVDFVLTANQVGADSAFRALPPRPLVVNATGVGKEEPGSPVSDTASFPRNGIVWDLNYRGDLRFLSQARAQQHERSLHVDDGWRAPGRMRDRHRLCRRSHPVWRANPRRLGRAHVRGDDDRDDLDDGRPQPKPLARVAGAVALLVDAVVRVKGRRGGAAAGVPARVGVIPAPVSCGKSTRFLGPTNAWIR
jgi:hypothetical protein